MENKDQDQVSFPEPNRKFLVGLLILIGLIAAFMIGLTYYKKVVEPRNQYNEAVQTYRKGDYEQALNQFSMLNGYRNADRYYDQSVKNLVTDYCERQKYAEALDVIDTYEDAQDYTDLVNASADDFIRQCCDEHDFEASQTYLIYASDSDQMKSYILDREYAYYKKHAKNLNHENFLRLKTLAARDYKDSRYFLAKYYDENATSEKALKAYRDYLGNSRSSTYAKQAKKRVQQISAQIWNEKVRRLLRRFRDRWSGSLDYDFCQVKFAWSDDTLVGLNIQDKYGKRFVPLISISNRRLTGYDSSNQLTYQIIYRGNDAYTLKRTADS